MGSVVTLHEPREGARARIEVTDIAPGEYTVGIHYADGDYVLAGAFPDYAQALDVAREKGRLLGLQVVDFSHIDEDDGPGPGAAA